MGFYNEIETRVPNRSAFDRSYKNRMSMQFDFLYPTMIEETIPGDTFRINQKNIARFAPMLAPAFADVKLYSHYFNVPRRIVEPFWKEFFNDDENISSQFHKKSFRLRMINCANASRNNSMMFIPSGELDAVHSVDGSPLAKKSLFECLTGLSLALGEATMETFDIAPFMAYQYIYNEYYRDSQIDADLFNIPYSGLWYLTSKGIEAYFAAFQKFLNSNGSSLYTRCYADDGTEIVFDVVSDMGNGILPVLSANWEEYRSNSSADVAAFASINLQIVKQLFELRKRRWYRDYFTAARTSVTPNEVPIVPVQFNDIRNSSVFEHLNQGEVYANSSSNGSTVNAIGGQGDGNVYTRMTKFGFTISALRLANALQKFGEKSVKFGLRYIEQIASHYGVILSDKTLQRPQYCGGSQSEAYVNEVTQTSESTDQSAQGNYSGHMMTANDGDSSEIFCEEHGYIFIITSVVCETAYSDGLARMFQRSGDRLNFYFPEFANLTDQEVKQKELYLVKCNSRQTVDNDSVFGYQGRYDEYRTRYNEFHGEFDDSLDYWHLGRKFDNPSSLNWSVGAGYDSELFQYTGGKLTAPLPGGDVILNVSGKEYTDTTKTYVIWRVGAVYQQAELIDGDSTGLPTSGNWNLLATKYNIMLGSIPYTWIVDKFSKIPYLAESIADGHELFAVLPDFDNPDTQVSSLAFNALIPRLNSSFITSKVSTRLFAETDDLHYLNAPDDYIMGDDYIFASFYNMIKAVRPIPISSEPKL